MKNQPLYFYDMELFQFGMFHVMLLEYTGVYHHLLDASSVSVFSLYRHTCRPTAIFKCIVHDVCNRVRDRHAYNNFALEEQG